MSTDLQELIDLARKHRMTAEEQDAQVRSFAYGNTHLENESITRDEVDRAVSALTAEAEPVPGA